VGEVLVGVGSVKGSPGVTTVALGLASVWPGRSVLLVEADPSGGDVGLWRRLGSDPGLVSLAGAARRGPPDDVDVLDHAHELGTGLWVVPGPAAAGQARAAVHLLTDRPGLLPAVGERFDAVIVDLGRLDPASPARGLLPAVDVLVLAGRGTVAELTHLASAAPDLADGAGAAMTGVVLTHGCRYRQREVEQALGVPLLAVLPPDPATAAMLAGAPSGRGGRRGRGQGPLLTTLGELASGLVPMARRRAPADGRATVQASPERPQLPPGRRRPAEAGTRALPSAAGSSSAGSARGAAPGLERSPTRRAPRTAEEAGWTRTIPVEPPGTARPAGRRTP
jgi:Mrp family chromosome partitioning ATPase